MWCAFILPTLVKVPVSILITFAYKLSFKDGEGVGFCNSQFGSWQRFKEDVSWQRPGGTLV